MKKGAGPVRDRSRGRSRRRCPRRRRSSPRPRRSSRKTERDLKRDRPLAEQRAIAQSQLDNDMQRARRRAGGRCRPPKAAVDTAELNLGFTRVTSLIDGVAAIASAQIGDLVGPTTLLTTVSQLDPIKAYFPLSEQEYLRHRRLSQRRRTRPRKLWQASGGLTPASSPTAAVYPRKGRVLAVDREVDPKMGTIRISALFPNPGNVLRPGQYGRVRAADDRAQAGPARAAARRLRAPERLPAARSPTATTRSRSRTRRRSVPRVGSRWIVEDGPASRASASIVDAPDACADGTRRRPTAATPAGGEPLTCPASSSAARSSRSSSRSSPCSSALVSLRGLPIAQFPQIVPPQIIVTAHVHRRRRADHRAVGGDAARAADERRRRHALHAVDQRQRRHDDS